MNLFGFLFVLLTPTLSLGSELKPILEILERGNITPNVLACALEEVTVPGCEVLQNDNQDVAQLKKCFATIMARASASMKANSNCKFTENFRTLNAATVRDEDAEQVVNCNEAFKQSLLCDLNEKEQTFMAAILVTWQEARGATGNYLTEYHGVRQVLENRTRMLKEKTPAKDFNILHAALQYKQFSGFNVDDRSWLISLDPALASTDYIAKSLKAYKNYSTSKCRPEIVCQNLISYHARWLPQSQVGWAQDNVGNLLPIVDFSFNNVYQSTASPSTMTRLPASEQKRRHWFYTDADKANLYGAPVIRCGSR